MSRIVKYVIAFETPVHPVSRRRGAASLTRSRLAGAAPRCPRRRRLIGPVTPALGPADAVSLHPGPRARLPRGLEALFKKK